MFQSLITLALALSVNANAQSGYSSNRIDNRAYQSQYGYASTGHEDAQVSAAEKKKYKGTTRLPAPRPTKIPAFPPGANYGTYYDWALGTDGTGYCGQYAPGGYRLNKGMPVANSFCEQVNPSFFHWGEAKNGTGYCYQFTAYSVVMNQGEPMENNDECEKMKKSQPTWARSVNGNTLCYQVTPNGYPMNEGNPVPDSNCYDNPPQPIQQKGN